MKRTKKVGLKNGLRSFFNPGICAAAGGPNGITGEKSHTRFLTALPRRTRGMKGVMMKDFLEFIDSRDIREYNRNTEFVPAEWAVLIRAGRKQTIEKKMEALQYLVDHYGEDEFGDGRVNISRSVYPSFDHKRPIREAVKRTLVLWQDILDDREKNEGAVFAASLEEKEYDQDNRRLTDYSFFFSYREAFAYLSGSKQKYLENENLKEVETSGEIRRIGMDGGYDIYRFDTQMRLVDLDEKVDRMTDEKGMLFSPLESSVYRIFVPLPFRQGDIVKVESRCGKPYYGVISCDWRRPEKREWITMSLPLNLYDSSTGEFDYTDGTEDCILNYSLCPDGELPKEEQVLKLIRAVRQGKLEFYMLLHKYGRKELDQVLEWNL